MNRIAATVATGFALSLSTMSYAAEQTLPTGFSAGPAFEGISEYRLANGLRVLLLPDPSVDTITSNIVYRVGSRHEGYGESGMAHLLEHMLFKGTTRHPSPRTEFLQRGARFNGTTSYDRTTYFQTFPANADNLEWAIRLEADRMVNARVAKADLDSEMTVVRNEFESGENSPFNVLRERMSASAYLWHGYGRAIIGARSDIENVPIERLQAFYRQYYQPDNAVFILSGRFEAAQALGLIAKEFGALAKPTRTLPTTYTEEPTQDGERQVVLRRAGNVQIVSAMYHIAPGTHPDYVPLDVLTSVINAQPSGRLHRALIEPGLAASVFGAERQLTEAGSAYFGATVREGGSIDAARDALLQSLESFATQPVTDEELERARTSLASAVERSLRDSRSLAVLLSEFVAMGDWRVLFWYRDQIAKVTREDVQRVALGYLKPQNRTLGLFIPTSTPNRAEIPRGPDLQAMLKDYHAAPGTTTVAAGEAFDPSPDAIEARLVRRTLPGGLKLALLPKKTRGEQVMASLTLRWGDEETKSDRNLACTVAGAMLSRGTQKRSREQLRDDLSRLRTNVSVSTEGATIDTNRANLAAALTAAAEMLRQPKFSEAEFEQVRRQALTGIDTQRTDPNALATVELQRHLNRYPATHWYYTPTMDERAARLKALTLDDVQRCHADLVGASNAELAIVGDFDPAPVTALAGALFDGWASPGKYNRVPVRLFDAKPLDQLIKTPDKANAVYRAAMKFALRDDDPDFAALVLGNYILGGSPDSRLNRRVREREGLSYSVGSGLTAGSQDAVGDFTVFAIYAPENRAKVEQAIADELARALRDGFAPDELANAKRGILEARRVARGQDSFLVGRLASYLVLDRSFQWDIDLEKKITTLSADDVRAAMRKYLSLDRLSVIRAGDFDRTQVKAVDTK